MKFLKKFFVIFFIATLFITNAKASERYDALKEKLTNYHFSFKYADMTENNELIEKIKKDSWGSGFDATEWFYRFLIRSDLENIVALKENDVVDVFCFKKGNTYPDYSTGSEFIADEDYCTIGVYDMTSDDGFEIKVTGEFIEVEGNKEYQNEALKIVGEIQKDFYVSDLDIVNHNINYVSTTASFFEGGNVLKEFKVMKNAVTENPNYEFFVGMEEVRRGDFLVGLEEGCTYIKRDGIIYGFTVNTYNAGYLFYVPKGTKVEDYKSVLKERIEKYIGDESKKINVVDDVIELQINDETVDLSVINASSLALGLFDMNQKEFNERFNTTVEEQRDLIDIDKESCNEEYGCVAVKVYKLIIDDKEYQIGIIEVDDELLASRGITTSKNLDTGIILKTSASNVPLDSELKVKDVTITEEKNEYLNKLGYRNVKTYGFELFSNILNQNISQFNNLTDVYLPLDDLDVNNLKILYTSDDLGSVELYDIDIEEIDGVKYMKFSTNHFSDYSLVEVISNPPTNTTNNPKTSDDIYLWFSLAGISVIGLSYLFIKNKKKD